jgi:probable HAF family extracellular repeat protein
VNNHGEVVGQSFSDGGCRAFLYTPAGGKVDLNELITAEDQARWDLEGAAGINDKGQIVGTGYLNGQKRAYRLTRGVDGAAAVVENLGTLGGDISKACDINDGEEVAGWSFDAQGTARAFVYTDVDGVEEMVDIGDLGIGSTSYAWEINNSGQVAGESGGTGFFQTHAFRYTPGVDGLPGVMEDLAPLAEYSKAHDINDNGHAVGSVCVGSVKGSLVDHAFLYTDHLIDLGTLGGYCSYAYGTNSSGEVVGVSAEATRGDTQLHGFLYTNKTNTGGFAMFKLQSLLVNPGDVQGPIRPEKINDAGQICGRVEGTNQAVLLTPVTP